MESLQVQDLAFWDRLSPEERERVERSAHSVRYGAGQMIWSGELDCLGILMIRSGVVRLFCPRIRKKTPAVSTHKRAKPR